MGFMIGDQVGMQVGLGWEKSTKWRGLSAKCGEAFLVKPMAYMNRSGEPLVTIAQFYKIEPHEVLIVLDDLALPLGRVRLRASGSAGGHNGLESIILQFGAEDIPRFRIAIGAAPREGAVDYALSRFFEGERPLVR